MSSYTGYSPKSPVRYTGIPLYASTIVARNRQPTGADYRQPETGKYYPTGSFWLVGPNPTTGSQGELWYLSEIVANVAYWLMLSAGTVGPILSIAVPLGVSPIVANGLGQITFTSTLGTISITGSSASPNNHNINFDLVGSGEAIDSIAVQTGTSPIVPTAAGLVTINGAVVLAGTNPVRSNGTGLNTLAIEVQISQAIIAGDATKIGLSNFDSAAFDVSAAGFVQLKGGGIATTSFNVDAHTAPGTDPVLPTAAGQVTITGAQVATGTIGANVLRTNSLAANSITIEIQRSTAVSSTDSTKNGVSHFNSLMFSVDANGFVSALPTVFAYTNVNFAASPYTVLTTDNYISVDSSGGAVVLRFPNAPTTYKKWYVKDRTGNASGNNISVTTVGGSVTIDGSTTYSLASNYSSIQLVFNATSYEVY